MYAASPSFTTESNQALPAALYSLTYLVGAGGSSLSGFMVAGWVGSPVGALLVPGCGSTGAGSVCGLVGLGSGGVSSGGASAPSVACAGWSPNCLPLDLLAPHLPSFGCCSASSSTDRNSSSVSSPGASLNCSSGSALPLPVLVNVAAVMPADQWDALPRGVCLVLPICSIN